MVDGSSQFAEGIGQLLDGADQLHTGFLDFDEKAIQKIIQLLDTDLLEVQDQVDLLKEADQSYQTFTDLSDSMDGNVKFIIRTEGIKKE